MKKSSEVMATTVGLQSDGNNTNTTSSGQPPRKAKSGSRFIQTYMRTTNKSVGGSKHPGNASPVFKARKTQRTKVFEISSAKEDKPHRGIYLREVRALLPFHRVKGWLSIPKVAAKTGASQTSLYGWIRSAKLPCHRIDSQLCLHEKHLPKVHELWFKNMGGAR